MCGTGFVTSRFAINALAPILDRRHARAQRRAVRGCGGSAPPNSLPLRAVTWAAPGRDGKAGSQIEQESRITMRGSAVPVQLLSAPRQSVNQHCLTIVRSASSGAFLDEAIRPLILIGLALVKTTEASSG